MKKPEGKVKEMERAIQDLETKKRQEDEKLERERERYQAFILCYFHFILFLRYKYQEQELKNILEGNSLLKEDLKIEKKKDVKKIHKLKQD